MTTATVAVELGTRSYQILIGSELLSQAGNILAPILARPRVWIATDNNIRALHYEQLAGGLSAVGIESELLVLDSGEKTKSWEGLMKVVDWLVACKIERQDMVLALGGGVVGDLVGFASAIVKRGVRYAQLPTSLLAQVDSSVGGKTGINLRHGKNLVGAFHQPSIVLADLASLHTLPERDLRAGYGEVAKYGLLGDAGFFEWLERNGNEALAGDDHLRLHLVRRSCEIKADIVAGDETEQGGRALLNLGHTFGHALEAATGYSARLLHGEAVAVGIGLAYELSHRLGHCDKEAPARVRAHFRSVGMKSRVLDIEGDLPSADKLVALMAQDKKVVSGRSRFVLVKGIGKAFVADGVDMDLVHSVLQVSLENKS